MVLYIFTKYILPFVVFSVVVSKVKSEKEFELFIVVRTKVVSLLVFKVSGKYVTLVEWLFGRFVVEDDESLCSLASEMVNVTSGSFVNNDVIFVDLCVELVSVNSVLLLLSAFDGIKGVAV